jgi:hypothetical protein
MAFATQRSISASPHLNLATEALDDRGDMRIWLWSKECAGVVVKILLIKFVSAPQLRSRPAGSIIHLAAKFVSFFLSLKYRLGLACPAVKKSENISKAKRHAGSRSLWLYAATESVVKGTNATFHRNATP